MSKTDIDILNEFLIKVANADKVSFRRKIVVIKRFINKVMEDTTMKSKRSKRTVVSDPA